MGPKEKNHHLPGKCALYSEDESSQDASPAIKSYLTRIIV